MQRARSLVALAVLLSGCTLGPDYERPDTHAGKAMPGVAPVTTSVAFTSDDPCPRWWELFHDRELDRLVDHALEANNDLRAAYARVLTARSVVRENFAPLLPSVSGL